MAERLYELLNHLMGDGVGKAVRKQFDLDPERVARGLDPRGRRALYTMSREFIGAQVGTEILDDFPLDAEQVLTAWREWFGGWNFPEGEFTDESLPPECKNMEGVEPSYPEPDPRVYSVAPAVAKTTDGTKDVEVVGQGFVRGKTRLELVDPIAGKTLDVANVTCAGTFRCGRLKASVTIPSTPGTYEVRVVVDAGAIGGQAIETAVPSTLTFSVEA